MLKPYTKKEQLKLIKKSSTDRKSLSKKCMALWQEIVKLKAGNICEYPNCNKTTYLNSHHFFSRSNTSIRYDIDNGICLCSGHHSLNDDSAHKSPLFKDVLLESGVRDNKWLQRLTMKSNNSSKLDLQMELMYLEQELKKYENGD